MGAPNPSLADYGELEILLTIAEETRLAELRLEHPDWSDEALSQCAREFAHEVLREAIASVGEQANHTPQPDETLLESIHQFADSKHFVSATSESYLSAAVTKSAQDYRSLLDQLTSAIQELSRLASSPGCAHLIYEVISAMAAQAEEVAQRHAALRPEAKHSIEEVRFFRSMTILRDITTAIRDTINQNRETWQLAGRFDDLVMTVLAKCQEAMPVYAATLATEWKGDSGLGPTIFVAGMIRTHLATHRPPSVDQRAPAAASADCANDVEDEGVQKGWRLDRALRILAGHDPQERERVLNGLLAHLAPQLLVGLESSEVASPKQLLKRLRNRAAKAIEGEAEIVEQGGVKGQVKFVRLVYEPFAEIDDSTNGCDSGTPEAPLAFEQWQVANPIEGLEGLWDALEKALLILPERRRAAYILHLQGQTEKQIAENLGMAVGTVKSHVFRANVQMKALLAEYRVS